VQDGIGKGIIGPEVGIEEFRKNLIGIISQEFHRNCMYF
jgi:hypothetical protein